MISAAGWPSLLAYLLIPGGIIACSIVPEFKRAGRTGLLRVAAVSLLLPPIAVVILAITLLSAEQMLPASLAQRWAIAWGVGGALSIAITGAIAGAAYGHLADAPALRRYCIGAGLVCAAPCLIGLAAAPPVLVGALWGMGCLFWTGCALGQVRRWATREQAALGRMCTRCGYSFAGLPPPVRVCPECGAEPHMEPIRRTM